MAKWHRNGDYDKPEKNVFVGQACLRARKPTAEGLMMPGRALSLFTKTHTAVLLLLVPFAILEGLNSAVLNMQQERCTQRQMAFKISPNFK